MISTQTRDIPEHPGIRDKDSQTLAASPAGTTIPVRHRRILTTLTLLALVVAGAGFGGPAGVAAADTAPPSWVSPTVSADVLPTWQINGVVWSQVVVNKTVYATGSFTKARPPGVAAGGLGEVSAQNIFAYDITTGNRVATFSHGLNAQGRAITASPDGSRIFVGGDFTTVDGISHPHVAAFVTSTGVLDNGFRASASGTVRAMSASATTLYVGGSFGSMNGSTRKSLAAVTPVSGALTSWAPTAENGSVWSMVVAPDKSRVIVGGAFMTLNGAPTLGMGSVSASTGASLPWAANRLIQDYGSSGAITSLRTQGGNIWGSGYAYLGDSNFEGTFEAKPGTGELVLVNDCHGDTYDVLPLGSVLYSVGHAHDCSAVGGFPDTNPRVRWQRALAQSTAATHTNTGPDAYGWNYAGLPASSILQWFPDFAKGTYTGQSQGPWSLAGNSSYVVMGGEFPTVNGIAQQGLVRMAVAAIAPNKVRPTYATKPPRTTPATTATPLGGGKVRVTFGSAWDMDNAWLSYDVLRDNVTVISSAKSSSNFWTLPTRTVTDSGLVAGSKHHYQIRISDPWGNTLFSPKSSTITA